MAAAYKAMFLSVIVEPSSSSRCLFGLVYDIFPYCVTVKTPIQNITRSAAKVFRIGGLFCIGGSLFWSKNIMNLNRYKNYIIHYALV